MSDFKFELNRDGVRELLTSPEMMRICEGYANKAKSQLGEGYSVTTHTGKNRVNASVAAQTFKARRENAENNTILKAVLSQ
jgi:hypothetical protein